jgi:hypothetical protein
MLLWILLRGCSFVWSNFQLFLNDITLLKTDQAFYMNMYVNRACLTRPNEDIPNGIPCIVAGWGAMDFASSEKRKFELVTAPFPRVLSHVWLKHFKRVLQYMYSMCFFFFSWPPPTGHGEDDGALYDRLREGEQEYAVLRWLRRGPTGFLYWRLGWSTHVHVRNFSTLSLL